MGLQRGVRRWGLIAGSAYASHLLVDLLRAGPKTSVYLFWPFSPKAGLLGMLAAWTARVRAHFHPERIWEHLFAEYDRLLRAAGRPTPVR